MVSIIIDYIQLQLLHMDSGQQNSIPSQMLHTENAQYDFISPKLIHSINFNQVVLYYQQLPQLFKPKELAKFITISSLGIKVLKQLSSLLLCITIRFIFYIGGGLPGSHYVMLIQVPECDIKRLCQDFPWCYFVFIYFHRRLVAGHPLPAIRFNDVVALQQCYTRRMYRALPVDIAAHLQCTT